MKKSLLPFFVLLFFAFAGKMTAQDYHGVQFDLRDSRFLELFKDFDFKGNFAVKAFTDETRNYYLVDFDLLPGKFEKVYFMTLAFQENRIVNVDGDLTHRQIWFSAYPQYTEKEVLDLFNMLRTKTVQVSTAWTDAEKNDWLKSNDKYK